MSIVTLDKKYYEDIIALYTQNERFFLSHGMVQALNIPMVLQSIANKNLEYCTTLKEVTLAYQQLTAFLARHSDLARQDIKRIESFKAALIESALSDESLVDYPDDPSHNLPSYNKKNKEISQKKDQNESPNKKSFRNNARFCFIATLGTFSAVALGFDGIYPILFIFLSAYWLPIVITAFVFSLISVFSFYAFDLRNVMKGSGLVSIISLKKPVVQYYLEQNELYCKYAKKLDNNIFYGKDFESDYDAYVERNEFLKIIGDDLFNKQESLAVIQRGKWHKLARYTTFFLATSFIFTTGFFVGITFMLELTKLSLTTAFVSVAVAAPIIAVALTIAFTTAYIFTFIERKAMGELVDKINGSPHAKIAEFREKEVNEKSANIDKKFKKTEEEKTTPASADDSSASVQYDVAFEAGAEPENNPPNNETSIFATADIDDSGEGVCLTGMSPTN